MLFSHFTVCYHRHCATLLILILFVQILKSLKFELLSFKNPSDTLGPKISYCLSSHIWSNCKQHALVKNWLRHRPFIWLINNPTQQLPLSIWTPLQTVVIGSDFLSSSADMRVAIVVLCLMWLGSCESRRLGRCDVVRIFKTQGLDGFEGFSLGNCEYFVIVVWHAWFICIN